jgi:hypothetical protein
MSRDEIDPVWHSHLCHSLNNVFGAANLVVLHSTIYPPPVAEVRRKPTVALQPDLGPHLPPLDRNVELAVDSAVHPRAWALPPHGETVIGIERLMLELVLMNLEHNKRSGD